MITVIIFIASLLSAFITYLAARGLFKNSDGTQKKKAGKKEVLFFFFLACLVILPVLQKNYQDKIDIKNQNANKIDAAKRDSIQRARYDSSLVASTLKIKNNFDSTDSNQTKILSKTLGEYHLALDKANNRIVRLVKDSSRTTIIEDGTPTLFVDKILLTKKENNTYTFGINFKSVNATSKDFEINLSTLFEDANFNNLRFNASNVLLDSTDEIPKEGEYEIFFNITTSQLFSYVIFWVHGTYKNNDKSKKFLINTVYYYGYPSGNNGIITGNTRKNIIDLVKRQP